MALCIPINPYMTLDYQCPVLDHLLKHRFKVNSLKRNLLYLRDWVIVEKLNMTARSLLRVLSAVSELAIFVMYLEIICLFHLVASIGSPLL